MFLKEFTILKNKIVNYCALLLKNINFEHDFLRISTTIFSIFKIFHDLCSLHFYTLLLIHVKCIDAFYC